MLTLVMWAVVVAAAAPECSAMQPHPEHLIALERNVETSRQPLGSQQHTFPSALISSSSHGLNSLSSAGGLAVHGTHEQLRLAICAYALAAFQGGLRMLPPKHGHQALGSDMLL